MIGASEIQDLSSQAYSRKSVDRKQVMWWTSEKLIFEILNH